MKRSLDTLATCLVLFTDGDIERYAPQSVLPLPVCLAHTFSYMCIHIYMVLNVYARIVLVRGFAFLSCAMRR